MVTISIAQITKEFPPSRKATSPTIAVDHVSLEIPTGNLFFLLGPSGCGKTTLLRMIAGFITPSSGRILFDGQEITFTPPHLRDTGMVFQSYALWPHMSVAENVGFGLDVRKIRNPERASRISEALALVQMEPFADRRPNQLSGGQQQRVALARAIAIRPKCLLLDEPLSNLDAKLRLEMRSEIRRIVKQSGITAIYVTHDQKEALSMADTIAVMNAGRLEQVGTPADLYQRPATRFVADFIGESNFVEGTVESVNGDRIVIKTPAGPLVAVNDIRRPTTANQRVTAAFRPETVALFDPARRLAPDPAVNRFAGKRIASSYLGEIAEHLIELPGLGQKIKGFEINPGRYPEGESPVVVQIPIDQVMVLQA